MPGNRIKADLPIEKLLEGLQDPGNVEAWHSFLDRYAPVLIRVAGQYAGDEEETQDCFLHLCEQLCANNCGRLQQFEPWRGASFRTWLIAVANNLCIDWHRSVYGRQTTPSAIQALPELEQLAYRFRVGQSLDLETCLIAMRRFYPRISRDRLSRALASVHAALSSRQRWRISARAQRGQLSLNAGNDDLLPADSENTPRRTAEAVQELAVLRSALSRLSPRKRLVLRLRYEQELSLKEVARVAGLGDLHQARRLIQAALGELQAHLADSGISN